MYVYIYIYIYTYREPARTDADSLATDADSKENP